MKNEQENNPNGNQDQPVKQEAVGNLGDQSQQQKKDNWTNGSTGKNQPLSNAGQASSQSQGNEKSNISVNNDGKIEKAHDQWNNDNNNRNANNDVGENQQPDVQLENNIAVQDPEINAPVSDPEQTEKKLPQMGSDKNKK